MRLLSLLFETVCSVWKILFKETSLFYFLRFSSYSSYFFSMQIFFPIEEKCKSAENTVNKQ